ncbi:VWA domain-containing protein [Streptomyces aurantiacus]|nr:VWA domain-containing protein [Streptomyces aurantiacus]
MGILTRLRNAFGKSRKGDAAAAAVPSASAAAEPTVPAARQETAPEPTPAAAEPEASVPTPATEPTPEPEAGPGLGSKPESESETETESETEFETKPKASAVDDLVSAAFDNVTVPKQAPAPEPEAEAETEAEAATEPAAEAEPVVEAEPEPVVAEVAPAAEPEAQPEPAVVAAEPELIIQLVPEPEPEAEQAVEAEPVAETAEAEAEAEAEADEPSAADVDEPAEKPSAAAKGEAEAEAPAEAPAAEPDEAEAATSADPAPDAPNTSDASDASDASDEVDASDEALTPTTPSPTPLPDIESQAPGLLSAYKAAATALDNQGLTGTSAKVYLVLDRSASMRPYYKDGSAQALGEQTLALAAHLAPEATVQVVFFSTELDGTGELTLAEHDNKIDELHAGLGRMGRTSYHAAVQEVIALHDKAGAPAAPGLVVFQTDGAPDAKTPATQSLTEAAKSHPGLFFSFVAFGEQDNKAFDYLRKLKSENTAFFHAGPTPRELTDTEVYEGVLANWRP